ncbi:MAG: hypothetical protein E7259_03910 [Lachnospiraceae bacterium]|nr:hypothetical protein [Lachnospiraceae bacterium]
MFKDLNQISCNKCGKQMKRENGVIKQDFLEVTKAWGYFSKKDGKTCNFTICEECFDKMIEEFKIPVEVTDTIELL